MAAGFPAISKDGKTYTFNLKRTYRFSNGARVTAANYAAAMNRNLNPRMASPAQPFIEDIVGTRRAKKTIQPFVPAPVLPTDAVHVSLEESR